MTVGMNLRMTNSKSLLSEAERKKVICDRNLVESSPFFEKMSETVELQQTQNDYFPITIGADILATLDVDSVYFQDLRKINNSC